jgi:hypothetical protein
MVRSVKPFPTAGVVSGVRSACPAQDSAGEPGGVRDDLAVTELIRKQLNLPRRHRRPVKSFHEAGQILNRQFGLPTRMRGGYRYDTIVPVATSLGVEEYELTCMQWLAHHFRTLEDLEARHPGAKKWSRAKILDFVDSLTQSRVPVGYEPKRGAAGRLSKAQARQVTRLLKSAGDAIAALDGIDLEQSEEVWDDVFKAIRELLRVTQWRLDVRFTVRRRSEPRCDAVDVPMW